MADWKVAFDSFRSTNRIIHGWGKIAGDGLFPSRVDLEIYDGEALVTKTTPAIINGNKETNTKTNEMAFIIYSTCSSHHKNTRYFLNLVWFNNKSIRVEIPPPQQINKRHFLFGHLDHPWKHYINRGWRLIHQGQWSLFFRKLINMGRAAFNSGLTPKKLLQWASRGYKNCALIVDHDLGGGANIYRTRITDEYRANGASPIILTAHHGLISYQLIGKRNRRYRFAHTRDLNEVFSELSKTDVNEVIFNNILSFPYPLTVIETLSNWLKANPKIKLTFLLHDFYCICPSWLLLNNNRSYCDIPKIDKCSTCIATNPAPFLSLAENLDITNWRKTWSSLLIQANEIRCFSNTSRNLLIKAHPNLDHSVITVIPHLPLSKLRPIHLFDSGCPVVCVIGHISEHKGSKIVQALAHYAYSNNYKLRIIVVGTIDIQLPPEIAVVNGPYEQIDLPEILERYQVNIGLFPSICPETFSFVTTEMMEMKLPIASFGLGAQGEKISGYTRGEIIPFQTPESVLESINNLYEQYIKTKKLP